MPDDPRYNGTYACSSSRWRSASLSSCKRRRPSPTSRRHGICKTSTAGASPIPQQILDRLRGANFIRGSHNDGRRFAVALNGR